MYQTKRGKKLLLSILCFGLFLYANISYAQITALPSSGCAPLVGVQFTGVAGSTGILWNFQDGTTASNLNPSHTFANPGTYNVTYSATVSGNPVNQTVVVQVFGRPTPVFVATTPTSGCFPLSVSFDDNSIGGGGSAIVNYSWSFGDGGVNTTNTPTPTYNYTLGGSFTVSVIVTDANGCDSSMVVPNMVKVSTQPDPIITTNPSPASSCTAPFTVTFNGSTSVSNSTTGSTALTYNWNLANGTTSTSATPPAVTYNTIGTYPVKLIVTDNNGCKDSVVLNVSIQAPHADFSVNDTVCKQVTFTNNSTLGNYIWDYGDGQVGASATHTYANTGTYQVKLTVTTASCLDDTTLTIVVEEPITNFTYTPSYTCTLPRTIAFTNTSTGAATYSWSFSESNTQYQALPISSTATNPTITLSDLDTNQYTINHLVVLMDVTLIATSPHGCTKQKVISVVDTIYIPTARFVPDKTLGCAPLTVQFSDSSLSRENIVTWRYEFDDGAVFNSGANGNTSHTYTQPGVYSPLLIIHNSKGCIDTSYRVLIYVGTPPHPDFTAAPSPVCVGDPVQFTSVFPASDSVDTWHFDSDANIFMSSCPQDPNPIWSYQNSTGPQDVSLTACWHGCCAKITKPAYINVDGPLAHLTARMNCDTPYTYIFTADLKDATSWTMDFGDTTAVVTTSALTSFTHTYAYRGDHFAILSAFNSGTSCATSTDTIQIKVREIIANIATDSTVCSGNSISFNATTSQDVYGAFKNGYVWIWGDGSGPTITDQPNSTHSFPTGIFTTKLIVTDANGCRDTTTHLVKSYGITPAFIASANYFCIPDTISFDNNSFADTTITNYAWTFGDGNNGTSTVAVPNISHLYTNAVPASFTINLTVTTALGCSASISKVITISKPTATFASTTGVNKCAGDSVHFLPAIQNQNAYSWNFGDLGTSAAVSPNHAYTNAGTYNVSLTVTDSIGCTKTNVLNSYIAIQNYPNAGFISSADTALQRCYPFVGLFSDTSQVNVFGSRAWDLGNGSLIVPNPQVGTVYTLPGTYTITLIETTTFGCVDSVTKSISVEGPLADFSLSQTTICKGDLITFTIFDTTDVFTYHWDFGDGYDTTAVSPIPHQYNFHPPGGSTNATLIFWSDDSTCVKTLSKPINISQVIALFDRNNETTATDTAHCIGTSDLFSNNSLAANGYNWNFGDGVVSGLQSPTHQYASAGIYDVMLSISSSIGCVDTIVKKMIIHALPTVTTKGGDTCAGTGIQIHATGGLDYVWTPSAGLSNDTIANPIASPNSSATYTVTVTDSNGCVSTKTAFVYIQQPPPQYTFDTTVVIGSPIQLTSTNGEINGYTYSWTPSDSLTCIICADPISHILHDIKYTLTISDSMGCFSLDSYYDIHVLPKSSVDVPSAFTPNGDGVNDIIYVGGWGIKKLLEFKIYNRWGELVFESTNIKDGWDGTFKGVPQNIETYVYQVKVETYVDKDPLVLKGYIKLFR